MHHQPSQHYLNENKGNFHFPSCAIYGLDTSAMLRVGSDKQKTCSDICIWDKSTHCFTCMGTERHAWIGISDSVKFGTSFCLAGGKKGHFFVHIKIDMILIHLLDTV